MIAIEEYLGAIYRPDCDFVDGEVRERNVGEVDHSLAQGAIMGFLWNRREFLSITILRHYHSSCCSDSGGAHTVSRARHCCGEWRSAIGPDS